MRVVLAFPLHSSTEDPPPKAPAWLFFGAVLARGQETVTSWIRARWPEHPIQPCYTTVAARRQEGQGHRRPPRVRGSQAPRRRPTEAHPGTRRHADSALRSVRPGSRHPSQPNSWSGGFAIRRCAFSKPDSGTVLIPPFAALREIFFLKRRPMRPRLARGRGLASP